MKQLSLPFNWLDVDWQDDSPPSTVSRPTEDAAIRNLARRQRAMTGRRDLEPLERIVYELELLCIRQYPHFMTPHQRAEYIARHPRVIIYNLTPAQIMAMLDDISKVLENDDIAANGITETGGPLMVDRLVMR